MLFVGLFQSHLILVRECGLKEQQLCSKATGPSASAYPLSSMHQAGWVAEDGFSCFLGFIFHDVSVLSTLKAVEREVMLPTLRWVAG